MKTRRKRAKATLKNGLRDLTALLQRAEGFDGVAAALRRGESGTIDGAWGSSCALAAAALIEQLAPSGKLTTASNSLSAEKRETRGPGTVLVVVPRLSEVDDMVADLAAFLDERPEVLPAWETVSRLQPASDPIFGARLRVVNRLASPTPPRIVVTAFPALLQPVPARDERNKASRTLHVGETLDLEEFLRWLTARGFERVPAIESPGEFAVHGGIFDLYPPDAVDPLRLELFGDEIESIRRFDVGSQRKIEDLREASLTALSRPVALAEENGKPRGSGDGEAEVTSTAGESVLDSLPDGSWMVLTEIQDLVDEGKHYLERLENPRGMYSVDATLARCLRWPTVSIAPLAASSFETTCHLRVESIERFTGARNEVLKELAGILGADERVLIACHNEGEQQRLRELLDEHDKKLSARVELCLGSVTRGFRLVEEKTIVLSDHELFHRTEIRRDVTRKRKLETRAIDTFLELTPGDLVVHLSHGIARFRGMELLQPKEGQAEEHLILEFHDNVRIFVPASLIHLVQKYVGATRGAPTLSKIGSGSWAKKKERVAAAVADLAGEMIRLQAARAARPGIACPPDSHLQGEFEAQFPYTETVDQLSAIHETKEDMMRPRPMDRLICGDVGYGKTEVAMRAAFKAIDAGRQVAVLVPTTVLAEQHFRTFSERMAEYPITIESLSRFRSKGEQRRILERMAEGTVDVVIGTHRIVQKDVVFKDLGLLIIDEEQRFGVEAKEMLKQLRLEVDVLTLSATPIPRTLHLSLLGIRDISNLQTPPVDRQAIETRISRFDKHLIRNAILRELNRGGQVYFVHNRVYNIQALADQVQSIVPEARIGIVHGQMNPDEMEQAMFDFVTARTDVLMATTIIESGLDIPNANTIFIHQADQYGLADLHQLRGRVGRYKHRAYCYLLLEEGRTLTSTGAKRLKAIEEFCELGAGFKIAMRDLEIRGAGNLLGTEQSGHISSVGYELYCQLLADSVQRLKKEPVREHHHVAVDLPVSAYLPSSYIPPGKAKIDVYRKLSQVRTLEQLEEVASEMRDRFGRPPAESAQLLAMKEIQLLAVNWQIDDIHLENKFAVFGYRNPRKIKMLAALSPHPLRVVDDKSAYLVLPYGQTPEGLLPLLKSVLQPS